MNQRRAHTVALALIVLAVAAAGLSGCYRGRPSEKTPIHVNPNMDDQPKFQPMERNPFFADEAAMRVPPAGTVPRGWLRLDTEYYTGKDESGRPIEDNPVTVTLPLLQRGENRYNIYCSPCHGKVGDGQGIIVKRGYVPPPTFHADRLREIEDGHIFDVITNGLRNMPSYRHQVPVDDRWAIVAYFRALQRSQNASREDVPQEVRKNLQ